MKSLAAAFAVLLATLAFLAPVAMAAHCEGDHEVACQADCDCACHTTAPDASGAGLAITQPRLRTERPCLTDILLRVRLSTADIFRPPAIA